MADTSNRHAEILFGNPPTNTVTAPPPVDSARRSAADVLFGEKATTASPRPAPAPTPKSHGDILFPNSALGLDLDDNMARIADVEGLTTAQQAEELRGFASIAKQFGLERHEARRLHDVYMKRRLTGDTDEWAAQAQHWATASRRSLRERFGASEAESLITELDALANTHPGLQRILEGGVGAHPDVVTMFAEQVRRRR